VPGFGWYILLFRFYGMLRAHPQVLLSRRKNARFAFAVYAGGSAGGTGILDILHKATDRTHMSNRKHIDGRSIEGVLEWRRDGVVEREGSREAVPCHAIPIWSSANLISAFQDTHSYHSHAPRWQTSASGHWKGQ
jgi:hypothetical protein